ncbi:hypothetical protein [Ramlibacter tataouinensis]|uniref:Lipoprotein n=1 Tax=Ramlibacter tataouinensis (strain ATCC BAA-407 / DSM 14655 / LMG 21543 / TTB310) TaxID=365046 RepID=F5Y2P0_RAMTT|nr:hypothetical protein [Ramlibacter tataouinensis]AEG92403.1 hypothetical protein Rta_13160 [Ramlibacter tataouinensis TTB310]
MGKARPHAHGWLAGLLLLLLAACSDGYPTDDQAPLSPFDMSPTERVGALNALGASAHPDTHWRYGLDGGCLLRVARRGDWWRWQESVHDLRGAAVQLQIGSDAADRRRYDVVIRPAGSAEGSVMLSSRREFEALQARQLARLLARDCTQSAP